MSRSRIWRRMAAVVVVFATLGVAGIALPQTASAIPGLSDCKEAPTPEVPGRGVEAFFQPAPGSAPPAGDPFAENATTSIYQQYGYAGLRWNTYDLGCTGGAGSPEASVGSTVANWLFTVPKAVVSATGALLGAAYEPSFLRVFDPLIQTVVDGLRRSVFDQWAGLVLAALGFLIVWRARRSSLRTTAAALGWALLVMMLATVLFRWPVAAGQAADATVVSTMSAVTSALNQTDAAGRSATGQLAAANLHDALLYQVWLGGQFGDANSVIARRYGPAIFDAQALTWAEAATLSQDPAAGQQIIEAKKAKFKQVAAQVQFEDPDAYEYLTGRRSDARIGFAALALLAVACAVPFLLLASLLVIGALVITRFAVMLFPAIATLGLFPAMRSLVIGVGNTVAAAIINAVVFGIGTAVLVKAFGVVMAPGTGLPSWLVVTLVLLLTLVMWFALRPFQRLTGMAAPGRNQFADAAGALGSVTRGLGRVSGRLMTTAAGVLVGDGGGRGKRTADDDREDARDRRRAEEEAHLHADRPDDDDAKAPAVRNGRAGPGGSHLGGSQRNGRTGGSEPLPAEGRPWWPRSRPATGSAAAGRSGRARSNDDHLVAAEVGLPRPSSSPGPTRRGTSPPVRRSEGVDLDDPAAWPPLARGGPSSADDTGDPYVVYRPEDRAGGGARA